MACEESFGTYPVPVCHEWNTIASPRNLAIATLRLTGHPLDPPSITC